MTAPSNPLLSPSGAPFGAPPLDRIRPEHLGPALEHALTQHRAAMEAIARDPRPADFRNTLVARELADRPLYEVVKVLKYYGANFGTPEIQALERAFMPRISQHEAEMLHVPGLYDRVRAVAEAQEALPDPETRRLAEYTLARFNRAGAGLDPQTKKQLVHMDARIARLETDFRQLLLKETEVRALFLTRDELEGLPPHAVSAAAAKAAQKGRPDAYAIGIDLATSSAFLRYSPRRDLREKVFTMRTERGSRGEYDTTPLIRDLVALRKEKANLLGFASFSHFALADTMAGSPQAVETLARELWEPLKQKFLAEKEQLQALQKEPVQPWDWSYLAEKVRQQSYALDQRELAPYFSLNRVIEAAFATAHNLFGVTMVPRADIPVPHPDVRTWEVQDRGGKTIGLFYGDYFSRSGKRGGAWMDVFSRQDKLEDGRLAFVTNCCNFAKPEAGVPALLTLDEARCVFHEFGHALHALLSDVTYPSLSGTYVLRDWLELPSQLFEHWLSTPEILGRYARHVETGDPLPLQLIQRMQAASTFNRGAMGLDTLASSCVDLAVHQHEAPETLDLRAFEREVMERYGLPEGIVPRHRLWHFQHSMGPVYASSHYAYTWAAVLDCDAFAAFEETGNFFDPATAQRLHREVYASGNTRDPSECYLAFRGRPHGTAAFRTARGLMP